MVRCISLLLSVTCCIASVAKVIQWTDRGSSVQRRGLVVPEDVQDTTTKPGIHRQLLYAALDYSQLLYVYKDNSDEHFDSLHTTILLHYLLANYIQKA